MCPSATEIASLVERARSGDSLAAREFLEQFEGDVRGIVRGRLPRRLRTQFDSMDFVQAVWESFFNGLRSRPRQFEDARHLRKYLAGVARNKVYEEYRRLTRCERRDIQREERLYVVQGEREIERPLASPEPTPSQAAQAGDRLAQLVAGCSPKEIQVITLRRQGLTCEEVAARAGVSDRTVRRILEEARARMEARG